MAQYRLTRNQAFPDHSDKAGDVIEVEDPGSDAWKALIEAKVLVPVKAKAAADAPKADSDAKAAQPKSGQSASDPNPKDQPSA